MKKLSYVSLFFAGLFFIAITSQATGLRTEFNEYEIESVDELNIGKNVQGIWTLSYSQDELPVTVVKRKTKEGTAYVVHSQYFDVSYAATKQGFGAKEVRRSWSDVHKKITRAVISNEELQRQRIITQNSVTDDKALGLIASFLPDLLNDGYTHLLN